MPRPTEVMFAIVGNILRLVIRLLQRSGLGTAAVGGAAGKFGIGVTTVPRWIVTPILVFGWLIQHAIDQHEGPNEGLRCVPCRDLQCLSVIRALVSPSKSVSLGTHN